MKFKFFTCDVFTRNRFGGNQLAVLPEAGGMTSAQMQQVANEFNYSETTFVLPPEQGQTSRVRIFTPMSEMPFAGHPNIGTAFVLASNGTLGEIGEPLTVTFEEEAGLVPVAIAKEPDGELRCELEAPQRLNVSQTVSCELTAAALSLDVTDICLEIHPPRVASVGVPFLLVQLESLAALTRADYNLAAMRQLSEQGVTPDILLYVVLDGKDQLRARMFAPMDGVPEDPATGSANCALAALLGQCDPAETGEFSWTITQGVEMGRPSILEARVSKANGVVTRSRIGGNCVMVSEGFIQVG